MITNKTRLVARSLYTLILILGITLAITVSYFLTKAEKTTLALVDKAIPSQQLTLDIGTLLTEQERLLYEYYAEEDGALVRRYHEVARELNSMIDELAKLPHGADYIDKIKQLTADIFAKSEPFIANLESNETDWDLSREQLNQLTELRSELLFILAKVIANIERDVIEQEESSKDLLSETRYIVIAVSFFIVLLTLYIAYYVKGYLTASATSERLSLFPMRNPNPILSLDEKEQVIYGNPAAQALLIGLGYNGTDFDALVPSDYHAISKQLRLGKSQVLKIEQNLLDKVLLYEFHWLSDVAQVDLHIIDITESKRYQQELKFLALHNPITGLYNINKLNQELKQRLDQQSTAPFCLAFLSIRKFNHLLSIHGLKAANEIQQVVANELESSLSSVANLHSVVYQIQEPTFALILEGVANDTILTTLYEHIENIIEAPFSTSCGEFNIEMDYGAVFYPEHAKNVEDIIKFAHTALNAASNYAHSSLVLYSTSLHEQLTRQAYLIEAMQQALLHNQFSLHYQAQLDLDKNCVVAAEALCRWQHEGEFIRPDEFIALAEISGQIIPLGNWILRTAINQCKYWYVNGIACTVAINISPRQFTQPNFVATVQHLIDEANIPPHYIELEITEGVLMHNELDIIATLRELKNIGVILSIDDFGTGYSSLAYLKQFPVDKLKIDQSFVRHCDNNIQDQAIIKTVIELAKNLKLGTIAEGVENRTQMTLLKQMGCDEIQGYYLSKPIPPADFEEFVHNQQKPCA